MPPRQDWIGIVLNGLEKRGLVQPTKYLMGNMDGYREYKGLGYVYGKPVHILVFLRHNAHDAQVQLVSKATGTYLFAIDKTGSKIEEYPQMAGKLEDFVFGFI